MVEKFFKEYTIQKIKEMGSVVNNYITYKKQVIKYYMNLMCTVCNPFTQKFIYFDQKMGSTITINTSNCITNFDIIDYEL